MSILDKIWRRFVFLLLIWTISEELTPAGISFAKHHFSFCLWIRTGKMRHSLIKLIQFLSLDNNWRSRRKRQCQRHEVRRPQAVRLPVALGSNCFPFAASISTNQFTIYSIIIIVQYNSFYFQFSTYIMTWLESFGNHHTV